jgi:hypothetical protein
MFDPIAIGAAVSALVYVTLGRRLLVWGGHPAITPMIWAAAEDMGIDYGAWVHLYQSLLYEDDFPAENARFQNVTYIDAVAGERDPSLAEMRRRMLGDFQYGLTGGNVRYHLTSSIPLPYGGCEHLYGR